MQHTKTGRTANWRVLFLLAGVLLAGVLLFLSSAHASKIYKCVTPEGVTVFQEKTCEEHASEEIRLEERGKPRPGRMRYTEKEEPEGSSSPPETNVHPLFKEETHTENALAALREAKRACGDRHNGRSRDQLERFSDLLGTLPEEDPRRDEKSEVDCHLEYMVKIEEFKIEGVGG